MMLHEHCSSCYDACCRIDPTDYDEGVCCKLIECPSGCRTPLHSCKVTEHLDQMCSSHVISCVNSSYGCPHQFPRHKLISHLRRCPASVVTCKMEWNRWLISEVTSHEQHITADSILSNEDVSNLLDISLANRDQKMLEESMKLPHNLKRSLSTSHTRHYPAVPLVQRRITPDGLDLMNTSFDVANFLAPEAETQQCPSPDVPGHAASTPSVHCSLCKARDDGQGLARSITSALSNVQNRSADARDVEDEDVSSNSKPEVGKIDGNSKIKVSLEMEMFNSFRSKPTNLLTFLCAQDLRRDQYSDHYQSVHCDIQSELDGWVQMRCPLSIYGCRFTQHRFVTNHHQRAVFNPVTDSFCIQSDAALPLDRSLDIEWFTSLPDLVTVIILSYMDSLSLKNLSLTSKAMREKCSYLLRNKGMVILDWQKVDDLWKSTEKVWSFSSAFQKPHKWKFAEVPSMGNHLKNCPYNVTAECYAEEGLNFHQKCLMTRENLNINNSNRSEAIAEMESDRGYTKHF